MGETKSAIAIRCCAQRYSITEDGNLLRPDGSEIDPLSTNKQGYAIIGFRRRKQRIDLQVPVHRICAYQKYGEALFAPSVVVRHLNGDKLDFRPTNISIGTMRENTQDNSDEVKQLITRAAREAAKERRLFSDSQVRRIRKRNAKGEGYQKLANELGCSKATIRGIVRRQFYRDVD